MGRTLNKFVPKPGRQRSRQHHRDMADCCRSLEYIGKAYWCQSGLFRIVRASEAANVQSCSFLIQCRINPASFNIAGEYWDLKIVDQRMKLYMGIHLLSLHVTLITVLLPYTYKSGVFLPQNEMLRLKTIMSSSIVYKLGVAVLQTSTIVRLSPKIHPGTLGWQ